MKKRTIISAAFILCSFAFVYGQQVDLEPRGCVTEEGKQLSFLVGEWTVRSKTRMARGSDKWKEIIGSSKIKFVFDRCLLTEKLSIKREGRPLDIFALYSYNNFSKKYQWVFAHSEHGLLSLYEGPLDKDTFTFRYALELGSRKIMFKRVLTRLSDGFRMVAWRSNDEGKSWRADSRLKYYR